MTWQKHCPTPSTMRLYVRFGTHTLALWLGDPQDIDQPRKRIIVLPRDRAAREDDPNVRLLRDMVQRQDAHDGLVKALEEIAEWAERPRTTTPRAAIGDIARGALAKAGVKPTADRQSQKPADAH